MQLFSRPKISALEASSILVEAHHDSYSRMRSLAKRHWAAGLPVPNSIVVEAQRIKEPMAQNMLFQDVAASWNIEPEMQRGLRRSLHKIATNIGLPSKAVSEGTLNWLAADEVVFHADQSLADSAAFLIWHVSGPARTVEFPWLGCGVTMAPGDALLFDGMHAHGVRRLDKKATPFAKSAGMKSAKAPLKEVAVFVSIDLPLTPKIERLMGIETQRLGGKKTSFRVEEKTGACQFT